MNAIRFVGSILISIFTDALSVICLSGYAAIAAIAIIVLGDADTVVEIDIMYAVVGLMIMFELVTLWAIRPWDKPKMRDSH